jgi:tRNA-uridine 2-sulfurtransferase
MPKPEQLVVAMSGGVDSSTAAALLKEQGHAVIGLTMQLWDYQRAESSHPEGEARHSGTCCSLDDVQDARRVAHYLNIPFYVINLEKEFEKAVVIPFLQSYLQGRTPIPCIACNTFLKFDNLLLKARQLGTSGLATGHYARIQRNSSTGRFELLRGADLSKDQSYFLFELTQEQMERIRFPLGAFTKKQIREMAVRQGLPVSEKAESQEICFIPHNDYGLFIEKYLSAQPLIFPSCALPGKGEIVDDSGRVLGEHEGYYHYTVGQRKGLGVAAGHPLYVLETQPSDNRVIVGSGEKLLKKGLRAHSLNWIAIDDLTAPMQVSAKIRNRHEAAPGTLYPLDDNCVYLEFNQPQRAITPGQAAVFYVDDLVIGGGWIKESR